MFIITKTFTFEAAHRLLGHPKCGRLHGHSYRATFELQAEDLPILGEHPSMVRDYAELGVIKNWIDENLDHRYLVGRELLESGDSVWAACSRDETIELPIFRTTAEELSRLFYDRWKIAFPELSAVTVCETEKTTATYRPLEG